MLRGIRVNRCLDYYIVDIWSDVSMCRIPCLDLGMVADVCFKIINERIGVQ